MRSSARLNEAFAVDASDHLFEPWCKVRLNENSWPITDDDCEKVVTVLEYKYPLANGRCLTEVPQLLAGAKEVTRLLRKHSTRRMSAKQQAVHHGDVLLIMHALSTRRISSLADIQYQDTIDVITRMRTGVDGLLQASLRLEAYFALIHDRSDLPEACLKYTPRGIACLNRKEIVRRCSLPETILTLPGAARVFAKVEERLGLRRLSKLFSAKFPLSVTQATIDRYASILRAMFMLRRDMECDALLFDPLEGEDAGALIRTGKAVEKTRIPPDALTFALLENCTGLLLEEGYATVRDHVQFSSGALIFYDHETALLNRRNVRRLGVACFVLIASFTGRRRSEILLLTRDCLAGNDGRGWWLRTLILKKGEPHYAWLPIPPLVARAIQLLKQLGEHMTGAKETDRLFAYYEPIVDQKVKLNPHTYLNEFAAEEGLLSYFTETGAQATWHWQTRQFRRFFAVVYFYRYGGSLEAVSYALRHHDLETTRGYLCLDGNLNAFFQAEEYRFKHKIMNDIANDNGGHYGTAAKRLKRYSEHLRKLLREKLTIMTVDEADLMIRYASKKMMVFRSMRWVTCTCPQTSEAVLTAKCHEYPTDKTEGPAIENGGPSICGRGCQYALMNTANQNYIRERAHGTESNTAGPPRNLFEHFQKMNLIVVERICNVGRAEK